MKHAAEVIVAGGGIAGLAVAIALRQRGVEALVLEQAPELQHPIADRRPSWTWHRDEKAVLIGDAAHPLTPNLGQGAAMALEDAWELAALWDHPEGMSCFQEKRRLRVLALWAISRRLGKLIQWKNPLLCSMRDLQMRATPDRLTTALMRRLLKYQPATGIS